MANEIYRTLGTPVTFKSSGGTVLWTPTSVAFQAGRKSAEWDRGAAALPYLYEWRAKMKLQATPVVRESLRFYLSSGDGTLYDGGVSAGDAAFTDEDALGNMWPAGTLVVDTTTTDSIQSSGIIEIWARYLVLVFWNDTAAETLSATATDHEYILTPIALQGQ